VDEAAALTHSIAWEMQARFSPDGKRIAYLSDAAGGDNVWVMDADGKNAQQVRRRTSASSTTRSGTRTASTSPRASTSRARAASAPARSGSITGAAGKGVALNEKPSWQKDLGEPAFSPDGRYVYYSQDTSPGRVFEYNRNARGEIYGIERLDLEDGRSSRS
jgi:Tol biopolymer transport system component